MVDFGQPVHQKVNLDKKCLFFCGINVDTVEKPNVRKPNKTCQSKTRNPDNQSQPNDIHIETDCSILNEP